MLELGEAATGVGEEPHPHRVLTAHAMRYLRLQRVAEGVAHCHQHAMWHRAIAVPWTWNLSRMPRHPRPVAPIWQPEVPARAILFLAEHPRRNMWVGLATTYTILGERIAPKLVDLYLGRFAMNGQQTDRDLPRRDPNLFQPGDADRDAGARGSVSDEAWSRDPQLWASTHRRGLLTGVTAAVGTAVGALAYRARHDGTSS